MHEHGHDELTGPVRGTAAWWRGMRAAAEQAGEGSLAPTALQENDARPIRTDLVERVRKEIADGAYDTDAKWEVALDRLLDRLQRDD